MLRPNYCTLEHANSMLSITRPTLVEIDLSFLFEKRSFFFEKKIFFSFIPESL